MSYTIVNPQEADSEQCAICLDALNKEQVYELPECGHKYHTNCIFHWMRKGHANCPYCGNTGEYENNDFNYCHRYNHELYKLLRRNARKKNAPIELKKLVEKLQKLEQKQKDLRKEYKEITNKSGSYKDIQKLHGRCRSKIWHVSSNIRKTKKARTNHQLPPIWDTLSAAICPHDNS